MSSNIKLKNANNKTLTLVNPDTVTVDSTINVLENAYTIATVNDFSTVPLGITTVIVKDKDRGGVFNRITSTTANDGTIFSGTGYSWERQYSGAVNVKWFGAVGDYYLPDGSVNTDPTDNTLAFQKAFDSFIGNEAGSVIIDGKYLISGNIEVNKTGLKLVGLGQKESEIISSNAGIMLKIKPLYNGSPYTSSAYCKFFMDNISFSAVGDAITSGTGLYLQWIFSCSWSNIYTSGFKKHIVLNGCHLNTFIGLYQSNMDATLQRLEIHNRGVALSGEPDTLGVSGNSTENCIKGGWLNNSSYDFTYILRTTIENIDIEPASNTIITGDGTKFFNNRFERFNLYAQQGQYPLFAWFEVGSDCIFENNNYQENGDNFSYSNPLFLVKGENNKIELPQTLVYTNSMVRLDTNAKNNDIVYQEPIVDYTSTTYPFMNIIYKNTFTNKITYMSKDKSYSIIEAGSKVYYNGIIQPNLTNSKNLDSFSLTLQGINKSTVDIALPDGVKDLESFIKLTVSSSSDSNVRAIINTNMTVDESGLYTASALVYCPTTNSGTTLFDAHYLYPSSTNIVKTNNWQYITSTVYLASGTNPSMQFNMKPSSSNGDYIYIGYLSISKGRISGYSYNRKDFPIKSPYYVSSRSGAGVALRLKNIPFNIEIKEVGTDKFYIGYGTWTSTALTITQLSANGIGTGATNLSGTITIIGVSDYIIKLSPIIEI